MDSVGRLLRLAALVVAASILMGFITACGNAVLALSDSKLEKLASDFAFGKRLKKFHNDPDLIINSNLAARTLIIVLIAAYGTQSAFIPLCRFLDEALPTEFRCVACLAAALLICTLSLTAVAAFGVVIPKKLSIGGVLDENFVIKAFVLYSFFLRLFAPLRFFISAVSKGVLAVLGLKSVPQAVEVTGEELMQLLDAANETGEIEDDQAEMISNIFEFSDLELHEVMTHRTEICAVECSCAVSEAVKISVETGFSRIPVYKDTIDDICGVIYIKDLLPLILKPDNCKALASDYMHKIKYVPETAGCGELFKYFTENKKQIAAILDEYGGTAGLVTMEDLLECIVGNIRDEYDENEAEDIQEITPHTFDILGGADPDEVMEILGEKLDEQHDYDTMGGFITDLLGYIPEEGQTPAVCWKNITFCVIAAKDNRIVKIRAVKDPKKAVVLDED